MALSRGSRGFALASACLIAACGDAPDPMIDDMIYVDASARDGDAADPPADDASRPDARSDFDAGDTLDAGPPDLDAGSLDDAGTDASRACATPCLPTGECDTATCVEGACIRAAAADGAACGTSGDICVLGACTLRECGDGYRESGPVPAREECDDGNATDGDGCSALCETSAIGMRGTIAAELAAPTLGGPALATDGTGASLAVWYTSAEMGRVMGLRFDAFGAPIDTVPLIIDAAVAENAAPVVAGRAGGGWAVAYVAGGAIQLRTVGTEGVPGPRQVVAADATATGADIVSLSTGFVVAWKETHAATDTDPYDGVRARLYTDAGAAMGAAITPSTRRIGNQQRVTLASVGDTWIAAWSHAPAFGKPGSSIVRGRRYRAATPIDTADLDLSLPGSFSPALTATASGQFVLAYEGVGGTSVDIGARRLPTAATDDIAWGPTSTAWSVAAGTRDERITSIAAAGDAGGVAVAYTIGLAATPGIHFAAAVPGADFAGVMTAWESDSVQNLTLAAARRGVVCLWSSRTDALRGMATRGVAMIYVGVE